jgi:hypothetical protein
MRKFLDRNKDGRIDSEDFKELIFDYQLYIILVGGVSLTILPLLNSMGYLQLDSDTFWVLAGVVISAEAVLEILNQRRKRDNGNK